MLVEPLLIPVTRPELSMVAIAGADEVHCGLTMGTTAFPENWDIEILVAAPARRLSDEGVATSRSGVAGLKPARSLHAMVKRHAALSQMRTTRFRAGRFIADTGRERRSSYHHVYKHLAAT
jgi:hypothetical protein